MLTDSETIRTGLDQRNAIACRPTPSVDSIDFEHVRLRRMTRHLSNLIRATRTSKDSKPARRSTLVLIPERCEVMLVFFTIDVVEQYQDGRENREHKGNHDMDPAEFNNGAAPI